MPSADIPEHETSQFFDFCWFDQLTCCYGSGVADDQLVRENQYRKATRILHETAIFVKFKLNQSPDLFIKGFTN
jgi:hypothetical protein